MIYYHLRWKGETYGVRAELQGMIGGNASKERKRKYFLWRNKLDTTRVQYSEMSKEEFIKFSKANERQFAYLERWEEQEEYKRLLYMLYADNFSYDILEVYNAVKENAKSGNATAVKSMLELQGIIKNKLNTIENKKEIKKKAKDKDKPDLILKV